MKRAITIISAFVVAALLTVAAQATSREGQSFEIREKGSAERLVSSGSSKPVGAAESRDRAGMDAVTGSGNTTH